MKNKNGQSRIFHKKPINLHFLYLFASFIQEIVVLYKMTVAGSDSTQRTPPTSAAVKNKTEMISAKKGPKIYGF
jgi:hypothetical protein